MRSRSLFLLSLGLNLVLVGIWWQARRHASPIISATVSRSVTNQVTHTNVVVRKQFFAWNELESTNYVTYIANLRSIGCPEATIRDIIVAEVNQLYEKRRNTEIITPEQQWWRTKRDPDALQGVVLQMRALDKERRTLLTELLGSGWEDTKLNVATGVILDGPILGALPAATKAAVQEIVERAQKSVAEYIAAQREEGFDVSPAELARLRQQTRKELAAVLTPEQLEEYLLRYSQTAVQMRQELQGFDTNPDEFRKLFRLRDQYGNLMDLYAGGEDAASAAKRTELMKQQDAAIQQDIGNDRFTLYKLSQDPAFAQAKEMAERIQAPAETVLPLYQLQQASLREQTRIQNNPELNDEQRAAALATADVNQQQAIRALLGDDAYARYRAANTK